MEQSLREAATEQAALHNEVLYTQQQLRNARASNSTSCTPASTSSNETRAILAGLGTTTEEIEIALRERDLSIGDLYAQLMEREKENEQLRQAKQAIETYVNDDDWMICI